MVPAAQSGGSGALGRVEDDSGASYRVVASPSARRLAREYAVDIAAVAEDALAGTDPETYDSEVFRVSEDLIRGWVDDVEDAVDDGDTGTGEVYRERTLATPATRRVAAELGVKLGEVPPIEEADAGAVVTADTVRAYAENGGASGVDAEAGEVRVPYRGIRRSIGEQMERSAYTAPHVTHTDDADVTRLVEVRESLGEEIDGLTYTPFLMKACTAALEAYPLLNSSLDEENEEIVQHGEYNIGVATATERGLLVPVVDDVDEKGLDELSDEVGTLAGRARDGDLELPEMQGGTFTITNVGVIGGEYATPIINYPEVGILAVGAIKERPRVVDGEVVPRYTAPLSLSFDHRVVDGAYAAQFMNEIIDQLEEPTPMVYNG